MFKKDINRFFLIKRNFKKLFIILEFQIFYIFYSFRYVVVIVGKLNKYSNFDIGVFMKILFLNKR